MPTISIDISFSLWWVVAIVGQIVWAYAIVAPIGNALESKFRRGLRQSRAKQRRAKRMKLLAAGPMIWAMYLLDGGWSEMRHYMKERRQRKRWERLEKEGRVEHMA